MGERRHRARIAVAYPDAPVGTCKHCGKPCASNRRTHDGCRERQAAANDYRGTAAAREGQKQRCVDCGFVEGQSRQVPGDRGGWRWERVKIQRDHPQELVDNGPRDWTVARCTVCHDIKTQQRKRERAMAKAKSKGRQWQPRDTKPRERKAAAKPSGGGATWWRVPVAVLLMVAAARLFSHPIDPTRLGEFRDRAVSALILGGIAALVVGVVVLAVRRVLANRAAAVRRLGDGIARHTQTDPTHMKVRIRRWRGLRPVRGKARYGSVFDDDEDSPGRETVERYIETKVGVALYFTWWPHLDTVEWRPATDADWVEEDDEEPAEPSVSEQVLAQQDRVEESVRSIVKGDVEFEWGPADAVGPLQVAIRYPSTYADESPDARFTLLQKVNSKAPGRWRAEWDTEQNVVTMVRRPPMPKIVEHPVPTPASADDTWRLPVGVDEEGQSVVWDLRDQPHMLVAGTTGGGKTVTISGILVEALARGFEVYIVDGKGTALAGFRNWPGVMASGLGEPDEMAEVMEDVEEMMRRRYRRVRDHGAEPEDFTPVLVVLDEAAEFATAVKKWHGGLPRVTVDDDGLRVNRSKDAPSLDSWRSIARLGREGHVHLVVGIQQAAASFFGGTESREQLPARIACGRLQPEGAVMMFARRDVGRDIPPTGAKGRATVELDHRGPREMQTYWTPTPKADGEVKPGDAVILDAFRAAAERHHHNPREARARRARAIEPRQEWERVDLDDLDEGDIVRVDEDGTMVEATLLAKPVESAAQEGVIEVDYQVAGGEPRLTLMDPDESIERRAKQVLA